MQAVIDIVNLFKNNCGYRDEHFDPPISSITSDAEWKHLSTISMVRLSEVCLGEEDTVKWRLFADPKPTSIRQGNIGNCW